jgi:hypothetical protein
MPALRPPPQDQYSYLWYLYIINGVLTCRLYAMPSGAGSLEWNLARLVSPRRCCNGKLCARGRSADSLSDIHTRIGVYSKLPLVFVDGAGDIASGLNMKYLRAALICARCRHRSDVGPRRSSCEAITLRYLPQHLHLHVLTCHTAVQSTP